MLFGRRTGYTLASGASSDQLSPRFQRPSDVVTPEEEPKFEQIIGMEDCYEETEEDSSLYAVPRAQGTAQLRRPFSPPFL